MEAEETVCIGERLGAAESGDVLGMFTNRTKACLRFGTKVC